MTLSIVVSSFNKPNKLKRCLWSLINNQPNSAEVILIDNGCNPKTIRAITTFGKNNSFKYYKTVVAGLAHARNIGWKKAKGEYIAYIDDDAVADTDWIISILNFIKHHPDVDAFGGSYISLNKSQIPLWIPPELTAHAYRARVARPLDLGYDWLTGTNMIFKRDALLTIGGFNENLGVNGEKRAYGEETELQIRLHNLGYIIWYDPKIKVKHEFARFKMNMTYLLKDQFINGHNSTEVFKHFKKTNRSYTASTILDRIFKPGIPLKRRIYYVLAPIFYTAGIIWAKLG